MQEVLEGRIAALDGDHAAEQSRFIRATLDIISKGVHPASLPATQVAVRQDPAGWAPGSGTTYCFREHVDVILERYR